MLSITTSPGPLPGRRPVSGTDRCGVHHGLALRRDTGAGRICRQVNVPVFVIEGVVAAAEDRRRPGVTAG
ncbi:hypothetical protein C731_0936 [Mycolicibacterium hassiacum DSM 44199]|uniref:Uncharacterized protein n=1 Tax=Mycolicibacterium hassiacum (strain DSM 44199 / CIP 105218 / JCM 12690 / 3849) TaxID=1122247 RepID=K5BKL2_MYCHD|nr:hypothetical protein C731_0936 [Mycolicibacterium hassiacum DSM 44199]